MINNYLYYLINLTKKYFFSLTIVIYKIITIQEVINLLAEW